MSTSRRIAAAAGSVSPTTSAVPSATPVSAAAPLSSPKPSPIQPTEHDPHVTNGAEATNLPPDADLPELTNAEPDEIIKRAKDDLDEGQVDTDMRTTPGLDAARRDKLLDDNKKG